MTYKSFVRRGALLSEADKVTLRTLDQELALLSQKFASNVLHATNAYQLVIKNEDDLDGVPERVRLAAKEEAEKRGIADAWVFTAQHPSARPLIKFAEKEAIRKEMYLATQTRGVTKEYDNRPVVLSIVQKRHERAVLLGYKNFAEYVLEDRMAKTTANVYTFLEELATAAKPKAHEDLKMLREHKQSIDPKSPLAQWDLAYLCDQISKKIYDFDEEETRDYFELTHVLDGMFEHATKLYGYTFILRDDIPVFHPEVFVYEVKTAAGKSAGIVYFDLFPRQSKRAGGWHDAIRLQHKRRDADIRPTILIVCNFTRPTADMPALFTKREVVTLFHEFGHALHTLSSDCTYASLASPNTAWDFVEFPSQFMQTFLTDKTSLKMIGKHYKSGKEIPDKMVDKMIEVSNFMSSLEMIPYVEYSLLDMKWHDGSAQGVTDVEAFENEVRKNYQLLPHYHGMNTSTVFKHIFDGGYAAGYYSYRWAEVIAADAFEYFKQNGLLNAELGASLRDKVLAKGNSEDPMEIYVAFRGKQPDPTALLRLTGLV